MTKLIIWAPRIMAILTALFIGMFALDVFNEGHGFWDTLMGLMIHLIPSFALAVIIAISWRRQLVGAAVFILVAVAYAVSVGSNHPDWVLGISGPLGLTGILYLLGWIKGRKKSEQK